jgi:hypothetical protein
MAGMAPWAESLPRRARHLIPAGLPRRGELIAVCAVAILVAHLLLAQLTLVLVLVLVAIDKTSRWRLWWLLGPAAAGLAWILAAGPGNALAGFAAGPSGIFRYLGEGHLAGHLGHPLTAFRGAQTWLPRQFPVALICGAAEAALIGWLGWLHTDEWAVPPPRPGMVAAARRAVAASAIRAGAVVTRDGCALGVVPATGAIAELRWADALRGTLIVGAAAQDVTLGGLQVVHAALRRRKPVIVLDTGDAAIARALGTACMATGTPLLTVGSGEAAGYAVQVAGTAGAGARDAEAAGASKLWGRGTARERQSGDQAASELGRVVRERSAGLLPADSPEMAALACAELASLAGDLRRIGVEGDALVWAPRGDRVPAQALAELLRDGPDAGLSVLIGTTSPTAATELGGLAGTVLIYRVADPALAAGLAARTGTRLLPAPVAAALAGQRQETGVRSAVPTPGDPVLLPAPAPAVTAAPATDLAPSPVIPARTLLTLSRAEFVLAVSAPRQRLIALGRMVPAGLPRPAAALGGPPGSRDMTLRDRRPRLPGRSR